MVAAAIVIAVGVAGALLLANDTQSPPAVTEPPATTVAPPATTVPPEPALDPEARAEAAVTRAEEYFPAINAGDIDPVASLFSPDEPLREADSHMLEFQSAFNSVYPFELRGCEATDAIDPFVIVDCSAVNPDPVWVAVGLTEIVFPWHVCDDGRMDWQTVRPSDFHDANRAYADYLELNHPDE